MSNEHCECDRFEELRVDYAKAILRAEKAEAELSRKTRELEKAESHLYDLKEFLDSDGFSIGWRDRFDMWKIQRSKND